MKAICLIITLIFLCVIFQGCDFDKREWERANKKNTIESYQYYLQKYPEGNFVVQAQDKIEMIEWRNVQGSKTIEPYQKFIEHYPEGKYTTTAKSYLENLLYNAVLKEPSVDYLEYYFAEYPEGNYTDAMMGINRHREKVRQLRDIIRSSKFDAVEKMDAADQLGSIGQYAFSAVPELISLLSHKEKYNVRRTFGGSAGWIVSFDLLSPADIAQEALQKITKENLGNTESKWRIWWENFEVPMINDSTKSDSEADIE